MKKVSLQELMPLIEEAFSRDQTVTIPVTGTSMRPTLDPGDAVVLQQVDAAAVRKGGVYLYRRSNGRFVLHRAVKVHDDTVDFCGDAQVEIECGVPRTALIAVVTAYEKDGKLHTVQELNQKGRRRACSRPIRNFAAEWHGARAAENESSSAKAKQFVKRYVRKHLLSIFLLCVFSCVGAVAMLGMAFASGRVIDKALGDDMQNFREWFYILFLLLIVVAVCNILHSNVRVRAVGRMKNAMCRDVLDALFSKQYASLNELHSGEILNRFVSDVQVIVDGSVTLIPQAMSLVTKLIGSVAFMLFIEPLFTTIVLLIGISITVLMRVFSRFQKRMHKDCQTAEGTVRSYLQECIENVVVIKSFANERPILEKLDEHQNDCLKKQVRRNTFVNAGTTMSYVGFTAAYYLGLAWGILRVAGALGTAMSIGTFTVLLQIMEQIRSPFRGASGVFSQYYAIFASAERLQELLDLPDETRELPPRSLDTIYRDMTSLHIRDLAFVYEDNKRIFENANVHFEKGRFTAVMGASGGGKSTLIKLLLGLLLPTEGELVCETEKGDVPITAATRPLFAFVPQGNMILSGTILENITFGRDRVKKEDLQNAISLACLNDVIDHLPDGLQTVVGERGIGLSEGQIQRVAVARAILSGAPVLLLDECTSALDPETERALLDNLRSLSDRTIISISHRPAVLDVADAVVRLDNRQFVLS